MPLLDAMRHHIKRAAALAGRGGWSPENDAEMLAEDINLERRLADQHARLRHLEALFEANSDRIDTIIGKVVAQRLAEREARERFPHAPPADGFAPTPTAACPKCAQPVDQIGEDADGTPYFWCANCGKEFQEATV